MVSDRKKKQRSERLLGRLGQLSNDFETGSKIQASEVAKETIATHNKYFVKICWLETSHEDSQNLTQAIERNIAGRDIKGMDKAVAVVENWLHGEMLTVLDSMVLGRNELAMRPITRSSSHGPNSIFPKHGRRDFSGYGKLLHA